MYNCINTECQRPSIYEVAIKTAWERLLEWRPDCVSCSSINCIETAMLLNFHKDTLFSAYACTASRGSGCQAAGRFHAF